jgi:hypothetical protein
MYLSGSTQDENINKGENDRKFCIQPLLLALIIEKNYREFPH